MGGSRDWLGRYLDGHRDEVWHELRQLGSAVREPGLAAQAQQVCDEMARRARYNVELITGRLIEQGYRFYANDDNQAPVRAHYPAGRGSGELADWLERAEPADLRGQGVTVAGPPWGVDVADLAVV